MDETSIRTCISSLRYAYFRQLVEFGQGGEKSKDTALTLQHDCNCSIQSSFKVGDGLAESSLL